MSILIFLAVLFVLILVHELGHFVVAKWTGMRVDEFGIGFPPKLFSLKIGETEYSLNALPIGGFVKILGEDGASAPSSPVPHEVREQSMSQRDETVGGTGAIYTKDSNDYNRSFVAKSKLAQAAVLIAGVAMNVLLAWVIFVVIYMAGVPTAVSETEATESAQLVVTEVIAESPAAVAGIPAGAEIIELATSYNAIPELTPSDFSAFTQTHAGESMRVTYLVGDETKTVELTAAPGVLAGESERPAVGLALALVEVQKQSFIEAIQSATFSTINALRAITVGVVGLLAGALTGSADLSQVAGPVGIVGMVDDAASFGFIALLSFTAFISLNLAVINLLPIPALDGGRLLFVAVEALIRRPINPIWMSRANFAGFALLILLMIVVTFNDVARLI